MKIFQPNKDSLVIDFQKDGVNNIEINQQGVSQPIISVGGQPVGIPMADCSEFAPLQFNNTAGVYTATLTSSEYISTLESLTPDLGYIQILNLKHTGIPDGFGVTLNGIYSCETEFAEPFGNVKYLTLSENVVDVSDRPNFKILPIVVSIQIFSLGPDSTGMVVMVTGLSGSST